MENSVMIEIRHQGIVGQAMEVIHSTMLEERLHTNKAPVLNCPSGDVYSLKIGAITADEVAFAGGVYRIANSNYYLYNGQGYWTMSPYRWYSSNDTYVFRVLYDGQLWHDVVYSNGVSVRPVINLRSDTTFKSGSAGTLDNPYVVQ